MSLVTAGSFERLLSVALQFSLRFQVLGLLTFSPGSILLLDKEDIISINRDGIE